MRYVRATFRLLRVGIHLIYAAALVAAVYPWAGRALRLRLKRHWSRQLLGLLGMHIEVVGNASHTPAMLVANHISWLDIYVINAVEPVAFVAKDDVRAWPLIGWLCDKTDTVFIARGNRRSAHVVGRQVAGMLGEGISVAVFPEGTTTEGRDVLPFRGALLQGAIDAGVAVQPLALHYVTASGEHAMEPAYCGATTLLESLWRIAGAPALKVVCRRLPPLPTAGQDRRSLAVACETSVRAGVNAGVGDFRRARELTYAIRVGPVLQPGKSPLTSGTSGGD